MFSSVPRDVKLHLMSFLRKNDLRNLSLVSKELNELRDVLDKERSSEALTVLKKYSPSLTLMVGKKQISLTYAARHCINLFDSIRNNLMQNKIKICFCGFRISLDEYPIFSLPNACSLAQSYKSNMEIAMKNLPLLSEERRDNLKDNSQLLLTLQTVFKSTLEERIAIILPDKDGKIYDKVEHFTQDCQMLGIACPFMLIISNTPVDLNRINYPSPFDFTIAKDLSSDTQVLTAIHNKIKQENGYVDQINTLQLVCQENKPENSNLISMRK